MTHAAWREQQAFKLRSLTFGVYLPTLLFSIGEGAVIPIIPLFARNRGASVAAAALVVAMRGLGTLLFDLPSGVVVSRFGDKGAMVTGTALVAIVAIGASLSRSALVLAVLILVMGGGWAFWQVARLAYVSEVTPLRHRGRALSLLGGISRAGTLIGPILGGFLGKHYGLESAFYAQAAMGVAASALMFNVVRKSSVEEASRGVSAGGRLVATVVAHRRIFLSAGLAVIALQMMRQCRDVFLPLWGNAIGLDVAQIGLVYSVSSLIDAGMFYPAGYVMDRWGRKWASVPSLLTLSLGFLILPLTSGLSDFTLVAMLIGVGNGLGPGIVMTLGADFSPDGRRGEFLGVWRFMGDVGSAGGPLIASFIAGVASLGLAAVVTSALGFIGAALMWLRVPESLRQ
ncbi:MAG TPA: MFS transporter [Candidatus Acidoferrum sp.]|nr:MFS transporter [Candidatus Acidoferrum sp.]